MTDNTAPKNSMGFMQILKWLAILLGLVLISIFGFKAYTMLRIDTSTKVEQSSTILLERIREVSKVITVEGYFSEIYDYKDYYLFDFLPLRKKALIRVKAKVSVGTDLTAAKMIADEATKTVTISAIPPAELLSIDHDIDYYDLSEGAFNNFEEKDYNKINAEAKDFIRQKAEESELLDMGDKRIKEYLHFIRNIVESAGWELVIQENTIQG